MGSKAKTVITFHSGILTIGGTVIEVSYGDAHIFFDFGTEYRPELGLKDDQLSTLLANRLVPELPGVYDPRLGYTYEGTAKQDYQETAVFLSHAHLDHSKMINYLDPNVPLYTLTETAAILRSLNRNGDFLIPSPFEAPHFTRELTGLGAGETVTIGEISVTILPVDHDAYGAAALLIHTPDKFLVYTGDLRLHGYDRQLTLDFCKAAAGCDLLMMEGVSISFDDREEDPDTMELLSEEDLIQQLVKLVAENPKRQLTFNGYPANVKRFAEIIKRAPRTVVLEANQAALLQEVLGLTVAYYYLPGAAKIASLAPELELSLVDLQQDDHQYLWQIVTDFETLQPGSLYFHLDAQPLGDFDPDYAPFLELLAKLEVTFVRLACSGHAFPEDLAEIIHLIHPKTLVPIHTLKPEKLVNPYGERILPTRGESIS